MSLPILCYLNVCRESRTIFNACKLTNAEKHCFTNLEFFSQGNKINPIEYKYVKLDLQYMESFSIIVVFAKVGGEQKLLKGGGGKNFRMS